MSKYRQLNDRDWVTPKRKGYKFCCCDCGLVHLVDFDLVKEGLYRRVIRFRLRRDNRATAQTRRYMEIK